MPFNLTFYGSVIPTMSVKIFKLNEFWCGIYMNPYYNIKNNIFMILTLNIK